MEQYSKYYVYGIYKFPIESKRTGNKYEVKISPYYGKYYDKGCIVTLYKKYWIFKRQLEQRQMKNNNSKITFEFLLYKDRDTDLQYNLTSMTTTIVNLYEDRIEYENKQMKDTYEEFKLFKEWNGVV